MPIWKERQRRSSPKPRVAPQALPWVSRTEFCNPERVEPEFGNEATALRSAGFQTCCIADFPVGSATTIRSGENCSSARGFGNPRYSRLESLRYNCAACRSHSSFGIWVESLPLTALIQPLQGCFPARPHPQGRRSGLAPTLGCMMERLWRFGQEKNAAWQSRTQRSADRRVPAVVACGLGRADAAVRAPRSCSQPANDLDYCGAKALAVNRAREANAEEFRLNTISCQTY